MSQLNVDTIKKADGTGNLTVPAETGTVVTTASPSLGRRNVALNGAMTISQRGTSHDFAGSNSGYTLDRFQFEKSATDQLQANISQVADAPDGFANSLKYTTSTAETTAEDGEFVRLTQKIEGQNIQHFKYGTASAQTVTLSFWVKSSITGTYAFSVYCDHSAQARLYGDTYTINSADTWEYKTIVIAGDTVGVPDNDNGENFRLQWWLDAGANYTSTDNTSWMNYTGAALAYGHAVRTLVTTSSATWQITGVQLEVGDTATPFEHRSYGEELAACQRYYLRYENTGDIYPICNACYYSSSAVYAVVNFPTTMRARPSLQSSSITDQFRIYRAGGPDFFTAVEFQTSGLNSYAFYNGNQVSGTTGHAGWIEIPSTGAYLAFDAEL